jgi:hypothetical protein
MLEGNSCEVGCPTGSRLKTTIDTQAAEIERLRGELDDIQAHVIDKWDGDTEHDDAPMHETIDAILTSIRDGWADEAAIQKDRALAAARSLRRLRASLEEAVEVMRLTFSFLTGIIEERPGDWAVGMLRNSTRDFITKQGGGS